MVHVAGVVSLLHPRTEINVSLQNFADCHQHDVGRLRFHHIAFGTGPERPLRVNFFVVQGKHENAQTGPPPQDLLDQFQAVGIREGDGRNHQRRLRGLNCSKGLLGGPRVAARHQVGLIVDQFRKSITSHRMILDDIDFLFEFRFRHNTSATLDSQSTIQT